MTELEVIRRKVVLKRQALKIIRDEIKGLKLREALLREKIRLERKMKEPFDSYLSLRIDAVIQHLEALT